MSPRFGSLKKYMSPDPIILSPVIIVFPMEGVGTLGLAIIKRLKTISITAVTISTSAWLKFFYDIKLYFFYLSYSPTIQDSIKNFILFLLCIIL